MFGTGWAGSVRETVCQRVLQDGLQTLIRESLELDLSIAKSVHPSHNASKASGCAQVGTHGERREILFVNLGEDRHYGLLNDLIYYG